MEPASLDHSPPRTPPPPIERFARNKGGPGVARPRMSRSSTTGNDARDENDAEGARDSHDLSWSPNRQRRSVLENMLLSLDQAAGNEPLILGPLSAGRGEGAAADDASKAVHGYSFSTPPRNRDRSDTGNSSISFYSPAVETQLSNNTHTRSHRSNSSLTFQPGLGRIDSVRNTREKKEQETLDEGDPLAVTPKAPASAAEPRRTSRASGGSSVDFGHSADGRWQTNHKRRSRSFDQGLMRSDPFASLDRRTFLFDSAEDQAKATAIYDCLEAAPMPTIPGGPRRFGESVPISPPMDSGDGARSSRRGSLRSPMAIFTRPERSQSPKRGEPRGERIERPSNLRHGSSYDDSSQPAQSFDLPDHTRSPFGASTASTPGSGIQRQGFFRRVFGSGKAISAISDPALSSSARTMSESAPGGLHQLDRMLHGSVPDGPQYTNSMNKDARRPRKGEKEKDTPALNKKPSFFRRRKKSISQTNGVPELPPQLHPDFPTNRVIADARERTASPSSLWQALDPFLTAPQGHDPEQGNRSSYEAPPHDHTDHDSVSRATIRAIQQSDQKDLVVSNSPRYAQETQPHSKSRYNRPKDLAINVEPQAIEADTEQNIMRSLVNATKATHARHLSDVDKALPTTPTTASKEKFTPTAKTSPKSARSKGKKKSTDVPVDTTVTMSASKASASTPGSHRKESGPHGSHKSKGSSGGTQTQQQQLWLVPDAIQQAPAKPPPPPPTSPSEVKRAMADFPRASIDEGSDYNTADSKPTSPAELAKAAAAQDASKQRSKEPAEVPIDEDMPTTEDREHAQKLFSGADGIDRGEAAALLGEEGAGRTRTRMAYMQLFDWTNMSILGAMRSFCSQTRLKGETQQVDRVLDALSSRWCECNPNHGFKATGETTAYPRASAY
jgi:Sec7 domain